MTPIPSVEWLASHTILPRPGCARCIWRTQRTCAHRALVEAVLNGPLPVEAQAAGRVSLDRAWAWCRGTFYIARRRSA